MADQRSRPRRICIAPVDIASYYSGLRDGFVALGIPCWFFCFDTSSYSRYRPAADAFWLERWIFACASLRWFGVSRVGRALHELLLAPLRLAAFVCAAARCDVFIFAFNRTFFRGFDLPLLRRLGRTTICVYNGSDTRAPWMSGNFVLGPGKPDVDEMQREARRQLRRLRRLEKSATGFVCHPLSGHFLRRPFYNFLRLGVPCAVSAATSYEPRATGPLRIVHAPTRPLQKGSDIFRSIVQRLRREGHAIDFVELTGRPNHEVLAAIAESDLVLDETYSDTALAGLGAEAAAAGRIAVVGGYGAREVEYFARGSGMPTEFLAHPDELERVIRRLVESPRARHEGGRRAQAFLQAEWTPLAVAKRYLRIIQGDAPAEWSVDPSTLTYWQGWGAPEWAIRGAIAATIARHGVAGLEISHNPRLEKHLRTLSETSSSSLHASPTPG